MAGFRKASPEQAALKIGIYGPTGSGKTFTTLLILEGLAKATGKRFAFVDTERGTDFYSQAVKERATHPEPFDFDALYSRSLTEVVSACRSLNPAEYCGVGIDSITHLWEAAINAYSGGRNRAAQIPMHAWGGIKKPYKELMNWMLNSPLHVFILGRQGNEWGEADGELVNLGYKMKAEGETAYEPHVLIRMEAIKPRPDKKNAKPDAHATAIPTAFVEKDRSGILFGKLIEWPGFPNVASPLMHLLGTKQAHIPNEEDTGAQDADALATADREKIAESAEMARRIIARFELCESATELKAIGKELTPAFKKEFTTTDLAKVRTAYQTRDNQLKGVAEPASDTNGSAA